jgi:hypothetical protein
MTPYHVLELVLVAAAVAAAAGYTVMVFRRRRTQREPCAGCHACGPPRR